MRNLKSGSESNKAPIQTEANRSAAPLVPLAASWCVGYTMTL